MEKTRTIMFSVLVSGLRFKVQFSIMASLFLFLEKASEKKGAIAIRHYFVNFD